MGKFVIWIRQISTLGSHRLSNRQQPEASLHSTAAYPALQLPPVFYYTASSIFL